MIATGWNPWKLTVIVMALVILTALITGAVVARWSGIDADGKAAGLRTPTQPEPAPAAPPQRVPSTPPRAAGGAP